jgi:hypothetical protein
MHTCRRRHLSDTPSKSAVALLGSFIFLLLQEVSGSQYKLEQCQELAVPVDVAVGFVPSKR